MVAQASCPGRAGPTPVSNNSFRRMSRVQSSSSRRPWSSLAFIELLSYLAWL
ncbi:unnamed protein product, partial [Ectocarpus sp. 12 AP-2014]